MTHVPTDVRLLDRLPVSGQSTQPHPHSPADPAAHAALRSVPPGCDPTATTTTATLAVAGAIPTVCFTPNTLPFAADTGAAVCTTAR